VYGSASLIIGQWTDKKPRFAGVSLLLDSGRAIRRFSFSGESLRQEAGSRTSTRTVDDPPGRYERLRSRN
jgi:hypothetical protein